MKTYNTKANLKALSPVSDRLSFLYVEHCMVNQDSCSITFTDKRGQAKVPSSMLAVLLLGPGCSITHRAIELIADSGTMVIWVGEEGVRYYCHGKPLTHSSSLLIKQAEFAVNERKRLYIARKMYSMRFANEDISHCTMQQLRGREGARVRDTYRRLSKETGVEWNGREYDPNDFENSNDINKALSAANICLYGLAHCVIVSLGLAPGLGFVHTGHERSFVYDIADLYKMETSVPVAFHTTAEHTGNLASEVRRNMRASFSDGKLLQRMVKDIYYLFCEEEDTYENPDISVVKLWDNKLGEVDSGVMYAPFDECDEELLLDEGDDRKKE